ncbi:hypothetical protein AFLA_009332 [Aspergillus flavus NRRL3357]|nr:hypothetical protein AFLA_009332 [Aspergillus flavus NRRL3357]
MGGNWCSSNHEDNNSPKTYCCQPVSPIYPTLLTCALADTYLIHGLEITNLRRLKAQLANALFCFVKQEFLESRQSSFRRAKSYRG